MPESDDEINAAGHLDTHGAVRWINENPELYVRLVSRIQTDALTWLMGEEREGGRPILAAMIWCSLLQRWLDDQFECRGCQDAIRCSIDNLARSGRDHGAVAVDRDGHQIVGPDDTIH